MNRKIAVALLVALLTVGMTAMATAQQAADTTEGETETTSEETETAGSSTADGGEVTDVLVGQTASSQYWAGFYGEVDAEVVLGAGEDRFFEWTVEDPSGSIVYAEPSDNANTVTADDLVGVGDDVEAEAVTGLDEATAGTEAASNTYEGTSAFTGANLVDEQTASVLTEDGESGTDEFESFLAGFDSGDGAPVDEEPVYATEALNEGDGFDDTVHDYQLLTGTDSGASTTYDFYLELP